MSKNLIKTKKSIKYNVEYSTRDSSIKNTNKNNSNSLFIKTFNNSNNNKVKFINDNNLKNKEIDRYIDAKFTIKNNLKKNCNSNNIVDYNKSLVSFNSITNFMKSNKFYYDLKNWKEKRLLSSNRSTKSSLNNRCSNYSNYNNYKYYVIPKSKLEYLNSINTNNPYILDLNIKHMHLVSPQKQLLLINNIDFKQSMYIPNNNIFKERKYFAKKNATNSSLGKVPD